MSDTANWLKDYVPLAAAIAAIVIALFQYFAARPKAKLEKVKLEEEIRGLSEVYKRNSENISEIQNELLE